VENAPQADHIHFLFDPRATLTAFGAQRRRMAAAAEDLSAEELASPSRCAGWTVADVLRHLVWVDVTIRRIWSGDNALAEGFDPRRTPNEAVRIDRAISDEEIRQRYLLSTDTMVADLECSDPQRFGQPSLSPAGAVPWWLSAVHVGWDSSIHERDVLLPLGRSPEQRDEETDPCLAYSLVLTSFFSGRDSLSVRLGIFTVHRSAGRVTVQGDEPDDPAPDSSAVVVADDPVQAVDAIAGRGSVEESLRGDAAVIHRLGGLARYFAKAP
jgi:uncharacterized protein (TIGR03083 family)